MIIINKAFLSTKYALIVLSLAVLTMTGCGQKGSLYLADSDSQMVSNSSGVLQSTSNPQDAAFAGIDDNDYQKNLYLEQEQAFPEVSDDPNDY
ncbi:lipoprotein [Psychrobacter urativorans]|uniref:LPS translocon maturation chaperone LptM n=1 Tax=Psychrobacter urativorans TaxID=45610 RepID=UPI0019180FA1|nr:lipoprotein [Psychrobacter urativorans]